MRSNSDKIAYSKEVIELVAVANEYCKLIESAGERPTESFIDLVHKLLAFLYLKTTLLPRAESIADEPLENFVDEVRYAHILNKLSECLGEYDIFVSVEETLTENGELSSIQVSECLADVYQAARDFVGICQLGTTDSIYEAVCMIRLNFMEYWGARLLACLGTLHTLRYKDGDQFLSDNQAKKSKNIWLGNLRPDGEFADDELN